MKLYHASQHKFEKIERRQASMVEGNTVPERELQNKIYLTPDLGFAIAMAAGPDGMTSLVNGTVSFEYYEQFDPGRTVHVYEVDAASLSPALLEKVDDEQYALDMDEITPLQVHEYQAKDVFDYYELVVWVHPSERK